MNYKRFENENEIAYIFRVCDAKDNIGSWEDVKNIINETLGYQRTSSAYRKMYQSFKKVYEVHMDKLTDDQKLLAEIKEQRYLLEKEKVKCRDERNALTRVKADAARQESLKDIFERKIEAFEKYEAPEMVISSSDCDAVIHLTDLHAGIAIDNFWNEYSSKIMVQRLREYSSRAKQIIDRHGCKTCYLVISGDLISGNIHFNLRIENRENIVEQIISVSEAISQFAADIAKAVDNLHIVAVSGNHGRATANKDMHLKGENFDELIPFYMKAKLSNYENVHFIKNSVDESIGTFFIKNKLAYVVHGDKDAPNNVVQRLTMMTGRKPDYVFAGHRHTNGITTVYDTKVIESGCLSGTDNFAIDNRLTNKPEQMIAICDENGLVCAYDVKLK